MWKCGISSSMCTFLYVVVSFRHLKCPHNRYIYVCMHNCCSQNLLLHMLCASWTWVQIPDIRNTQINAEYSGNVFVQKIFTSVNTPMVVMRNNNNNYNEFQTVILLFPFWIRTVTALGTEYKTTWWYTKEKPTELNTYQENKVEESLFG